MLLESTWYRENGDSRRSPPNPDKRLERLVFFRVIEEEHEQTRNQPPEGGAHAPDRQAGSRDREGRGGRHALALVLEREAGRLDGRETVMTVTFAEVEGGTEMTFHCADTDPRPEHAGVQQGWASSFDRLAGLLAAH